MKFTVSKIIKIEQKHKYASESPTNFALLFCCMLFVYFHFGKGKSVIFTYKNNRKLKTIENRPRNASQNYLLEREILARNCVCFDIKKQFTNRSFAGSRKARKVFPHKNKHFYKFYLQNFVNHFFLPSLVFIDIKSFIIYRISCSTPQQNKQPF